MSARPTFVYYANEMRMTDQYRHLLGCLRQGCSPTHAKLADRIEEDTREFPIAVEGDLIAIRRGLADGNHPFAHADLFVFTNQSALSGHAQVGHRGNQELQRIPFTVPHADRMAFKLHPLSRPEVFTEALRTVSRQTAGTSPIILVTKSHGNQSLTLTSLLSVLLDAKTAEEVDRAVEVLKSGPASAGVPGGSFLGPDFLLEVWNGIGTQKGVYTQCLQQACAGGEVFDLVVTESCNANFPEYLVDALPAEVRRFQALVNPTSYTNVPYDVAFERMRGGQSLPDALVSVLGEAFVRER
ncbi:MAG: hypothetical protein K8U57_11120 [Planctomycetes bacterium]|nr:hypothetical protein [Planctomycetota bacterium]